MKTITILFILSIISSHSFAYTKLVSISKSIEIDVNKERVFEIVSNTMNDHLWRSEVNSMEADGEFAVGTIFTEDAHIGFRKHFITSTQLIELIEDKKAFYVTPPNAPFYLSSKREVKTLQNGGTIFTYTVLFDPKMSRSTLGVAVPVKVLEISYGVIIKTYLKNLKKFLN